MLRISQRNERKTVAKRDGQFCCSFAANSLSHLLSKNYQNRTRLGKVLQKYKDAIFDSQRTLKVLYGNQLIKLKI